MFSLKTRAPTRGPQREDDTPGRLECRVGVDWTPQHGGPAQADRWAGAAGLCDGESRRKLSAWLDRGAQTRGPGPATLLPLGPREGPVAPAFWGVLSPSRSSVGPQQGYRPGLCGIRPLSHRPVWSHCRAAPRAGSRAGFQEGDGFRGGPVGPSLKPVSGRWGPAKVAGAGLLWGLLCREAGASWARLCQDARSWGHHAPGR